MKFMKLGCFVLIFVYLSCLPFVKRMEIKPEFVRIPEFRNSYLLTDERVYKIRVQKYDCLSCIVEKCLNDYLREHNCIGLYGFGVTLYEIAGSIRTKSRNPDLIYPGEIIAFKLPKIIKIEVFNYYEPRKQSYGLDSLKKLLDFYWMIPYNVGNFNCSERAGFVEYYLENEGFNTDIVENENHAWCLVEINPGEWINVESVASPPAIGKAPRQYKVRYENIWKAIKVEPNEYDWWRKTEGAVFERK